MIKIIFLIWSFLPKELPPVDSFDFAIAISVQVDMDFHPCKCGHPPFRGGDIARRTSVIKKLKKKYGNKILYFDAGNFIKLNQYVPYAPPIFSEIAKEMKIDAMGVGYNEQIGGIDFLKKWANKFPFATLIPSIDFIKKDLTFNLNNFKIVFTSYSPFYGQKSPEPVEKYFKNPVKNKTLYVFATNNMLPEFFENLPENLVFIYGANHKFKTVLDTIKHKFIYIVPSRYGIYFPILFFKYVDGKFKIKYFYEIPLDSHIPSDEKINTLEKKFNEEKKKFAEEREKALQQKRQEIKRETKIKSSADCGKCHKKEYKSYLLSSHKKSFKTLKKNNRDKDVKCMRCHVTGFGYRGGFVSEIETPELAEVGCVECHGLLYYHPEKQKAKKVTESTCKKCHNQEWSPDFNFEDYRKRILH